MQRTRTWLSAHQFQPTYRPSQGTLVGILVDSIDCSGPMYVANNMAPKRQPWYSSLCCEMQDKMIVPRV
jgi:hypothetical protein